MYENLAVSERITIAKTKIARVVDHLLYLLAIHENNALVVYSPLLSSQIQPSYGANAFNAFQQALHHFEIVRLCALWDSIDAAKENIPTIVELVDNPKVIDALVTETYSQLASRGSYLINPSSDPALAAEERLVLDDIDNQFALEQSAKARRELEKVISEARAIKSSTRLASILNLRDKHLAHSLTETNRERKNGPIAPMKYGDEREILVASLSIVQTLYLWVSGTSFNFEDSREIAQKNASALWNGCSFKVLR